MGKNRNEARRKQYVVFGAGKFGSSVAVTLQELGCDVIVIDKNPEIIQEIADRVSYAICADVEDPETFGELSSEDLDGAIISMTGSLETSIMTTMLCSEKGVRRILVKARNEMHEKILLKVGATKVIHPEVDMGRRVAKYIAGDNFADWIELSPKYSLVEMAVPSAWRGRSLVQLKIREEYGINVIGIKKENEVRINLDPKDPLGGDETLIVVGENRVLETFK